MFKKAAKPSSQNAQVSNSVSLIEQETAVPHHMSKIEGIIDLIDGDRITGWAYDPSALGRRLLIEICAGEMRNIVTANVDRPDLRSAGKGDGRYGFDAAFDAGAAGSAAICVREVSTGQELVGSPVRVDLLHLLTSPLNRPYLDNLRSEVQLTSLNLSSTPNSTTAFDGYEQELETGSLGGYATRGQVGTLYETAFPDLDPEGLITRYVAFEFHRLRQDQTLTINGNITERLRVLHWYLAVYGPHRSLPLPLSNRQIAFLNAPMPLIGSSREISIAAYGFITREWSGKLDIENEASLRDALFWWCTERAPRIEPGGALITPAQVRMLTHTEPNDVGPKFPVNWFVRQVHKRDPLLAKYDLNSMMGRGAIICSLILRCAAEPYIAKLLPAEAVADLFHNRKEQDTPLFLGILSVALSSNEILDVRRSSELKARLIERLGQHGLYLEAQWRKPTHGQLGVGVPFVQDPKIRSRLEPGIAVVGPTRIAAGLGQATRLSIDVLVQAGRAPVVLDFALGNPGRVGFSAKSAAPILKAPRQINLVHLNAESIPLAFAYLDKRLFERSYNIGYVFWELDQLPKCHALGLDLVDEIWVSSEYNREIYARTASVPVYNVGMAVEPLPAATRVCRRDFGLDDDAFVFLATFDAFSFVERKNPLAVLRAFQAAFPVKGAPHVALVLKTQNRTRVGDPHQLRVWQAIDDLVAGDSRIRIIDHTLSYADLLGFKQLCDAYVSLHRSEGWGFGMIEAMQLKRPVITTAYSGNMEYCSVETAFLVDYALVAPTPAEYVFVERGSRWAEPCIASAAAAMREVVEAPAQAKGRVEAAYRRVRDEFSLSAIARRYAARLTAIETILAGGQHKSDTNR